MFKKKKNLRNHHSINYLKAVSSFNLLRWSPPAASASHTRKSAGLLSVHTSLCPVLDILSGDVEPLLCAQVSCVVGTRDRLNQAQFTTCLSLLLLACYLLSVSEFRELNSSVALPCPDGLLRDVTQAQI